MFIHELAQHTGVSAKAIRYYETVGLLPPPQRAANNYRRYTAAAISRLRFIASARRLGFSIADIAEFLAGRDPGRLPCHQVLSSLDRRLADIDRRIADLLAVRETLDRIRRDGAALPQDGVCNEQCVCALITVHHDCGHSTPHREEK
jgi:DNA-binding transcriptional MerR regulator